jgi:hypothetical protein
MSTDGKIVTFESYYDPMLAHIVRTRLEASGIPCFIADENTLWANPYHNQAIGGVKIKVFENDLERCYEILATEADSDNDIEEETINAIICPFCGSKNVRYGPATEKRVHWFIATISLLLLIFPFYAHYAWHCFNCQRDFKQPK